MMLGSSDQGRRSSDAIRLAPEERSVLRLLLGHVLDPGKLEAMLENATVVNREYSGTGYFCHFKEENMKCLADVDLRQLPSIVGKHPALQYGFGTLLSNEGQCGACLEFFSYEEPWPEDLASGFQVEAATPRQI